MSNATIEKEDHGAANARGWWSSIQEMVAAFEAAQEDGAERDALEAAERAIDESMLSVEVRSSWHTPGGVSGDRKPSEYRILLTTGGPALQLVSDLSEYGEPETAKLQIQDWFKPWSEWRPDDAPDYEKTLLTFARRFFFGE